MIRVNYIAHSGKRTSTTINLQIAEFYAHHQGLDCLENMIEYHYQVRQLIQSYVNKLEGFDKKSIEKSLLQATELVIKHQ